jgi:hypothetical protein
MPFVCEQYAPASAAALLAEIEVMLVSAGWTLHDNVSATVKVYKSNGELGDRIYEYIWLSLTGSSITVFAYGWWDNAAHTGNCRGNSGPTIVYAAGEKRIIGGTKNLFYAYKLGTHAFFGHIPKRTDIKPLATLTAPAVAGANAVLTVDNVDMFVTNMTYQIFGPTGEGRYPVKVTVVAPLAITVANLPVNMATGSMIGACPSLFGAATSQTGTFYNTCPWNTSGTGIAAASAVFGTPFINVNYLDPDDRLGTGTGTTGLYVLQNVVFNEGSSVVGYSDSNVLFSPVGVDWTIFGDVNLSSGQPRDTGTATAGANFTLTCAGKLWGINAWANKFVAIMSGVGAGQTRKIASNTADTLTVGVQWDTNPDITSIFAIFDVVYRDSMTNPPIAFREVINS